MLSRSLTDSYLLYLPVRVPREPPARVLKCGASPRVPGATDSPSLGVVVLRPLAAPSRLLSPRLGDLRARQASATRERERERERQVVLQQEKDDHFKPHN